MHKVLICGDRFWTDREAIRRVLKELIRDHGVSKLLIISGKARGADTIAAEEARRLNVHVAEVGALWATRGRGAGPQRNAVMLALDPDEVIGFHNKLAESRGTADMLKQADKRCISWRHETS